MAFDIQEVLKQCYWAAREYRSNPSDDYIIEKIVGFIDSNNLMADKYADLVQPRAVEKVEKVEREALQLEILSDFDSATQIEKLLILEVVDYLFGKGFIVAAQQKKAGADPLAGTPDGVCS